MEQIQLIHDLKNVLSVNSKDQQIVSNLLKQSYTHWNKYEYNRHTICYMFPYFLSAIIMKSLYRLKLCPSNRHNWKRLGVLET